MEEETSRRPEPSSLASVFVRLGKQLAFLVNSFRKGDGRTRLSYVLMGFSNLARGQVAKGIVLRANAVRGEAARIAQRAPEQGGDRLL